MTEEGKNVIDKTGVYVIDQEGDLTTPLIDNKQCAFVFEDSGISKCSIEKAHAENKINFKKPISCHLYPIRITTYKKFDAINYEANEICSPACKLGQEMQVSVFKFFKRTAYSKIWKRFL